MSEIRSMIQIAGIVGSQNLTGMVPVPSSYLASEAKDVQQTDTAIDQLANLHSDTLRDLAPLP